MHTACMATKTISLRLDAYERLRRARRFPHESFTDVVLRAVWPESTLTGRGLEAFLTEHGPFFTDEELDRIEDAKRNDQPPGEKWPDG